MPFRVVEQHQKCRHYSQNINVYLSLFLFHVLLLLISLIFNKNTICPVESQLSAVPYPNNSIMVAVYRRR